ncbi:hypothetical protein CAEBREN_31490 [Caenorhabditis brenneri]|uniref:Uncharacterized protein n=1 Tax=Caenorhabditis brenneri TaxID=135651 RepID=G0NBG1_CAEBE|nr:hypothetical protein CAEBREN_31490 [Caenorhabditis brenneri]
MEVDSRVYYSVENPDRSLQVYVMPIVNFISTIVNVLLFYLIFKHSEKESSSYRKVIFLHSFSLYMAQLFWGSIINMVFLLPFPAVYSLGPLKNYINCFYLTSVWFALFAWSALMMFLILLVRLRTLARPDSVFSFTSSTYNSIIVFLVVYAFIPIFAAWIPGYSSDEKTREYVFKYYPNCMKILEIPGIFVNTSQAAIVAVTIAAFGLLSSGAVFYILLCFIIVYEIRKQSSSWSSKKRKYHIKVLQDAVVTNVVKCIFLAAAPATELWNIFLDPSRDTIMITMIANFIFVAAPIPCTIVMFVQNRAYRKFFAQKFGCGDLLSKQDMTRKSGIVTVHQKTAFSKN